MEVLLSPRTNRCYPLSNLPRDELRTASLALVVEQDPRHHKHPMRLAVIHGKMVGIDLRHAIG